MRKTSYITRLFLSGFFIVVSLVSCRKDISPYGEIRLQLKSDYAVKDLTKSQITDFTKAPVPEQFSFILKDSKGKETVITDLATPLKLRNGKYSAYAFYGEKGAEGWDKPYFEGTEKFEILGDSKSVEVKASLANCLVKIETTEMFRKYFSDWNFTITSVAGNKVEFNKEEKRAAFFEAFMIKVSGSLKCPDGSEYKIENKEYNNLAAATCHVLRFDASNVGGTSIFIVFDDSVEEVKIGDFEIKD